jgi:hypothetical protein
MVYDLNSWFPGDGSFKNWQEARMRVFDPEQYDTPKETNWSNYFVGVDLGRVRDYSAAAIIEFKTAPSGKRFHYVKYLKRFPLKTTYTKIAEMLAGIDRQLRAVAEGAGKEADITWSVDSGGVGDGVVEIIASKMGPNVELYRVYLTGGINASTDYDNRQIRLPKNQMVSCLLGCFDSDRIFLSKRSRELDAIKEELQNFEIKISEGAGRESFNAKIGSHDDLICALGIAAWCGEQSGEPIKMW